MSNGIVEQLKGLEREKARLDNLLAPDPDWQVYHGLINASPGRPETELANEIELPVDVADALGTNRLFQARRKILDAIDLLEDLLARPGAYPDALAPRETPPQAGRQEDAADRSPDSVPRREDVIPAEVSGRFGAPDLATAGAGEAFRTKVKVKSPSPPPGTQSQSETSVSPFSAGDDLTRIEGVDRERALQLRTLGMTTFAAVAGWSQADIARIAHELGVGGDIVSQDWVGQAQRLLEIAPADTLAKRDAGTAAESSNGTPDGEAERIDTDSGPDQLSRAVGDKTAPLSAGISAADVNLDAKASRLVSVDRPVEIEPATDAAGAEDSINDESLVPDVVPGAAIATAIGALAVAANDDQPDDLTQIKGINSADCAFLHRQGIVGFATIADWTAADVKRFRVLLGDPKRISREQWIEQAALLGSAKPTAFTLARAMRVPLVPPPPDSPWERRPPIVAEPDATEASPAHTATGEEHDGSAEPTPTQPPSQAVDRSTPQAGTVPTAEIANEVKTANDVVADADRRQAALNERIARLEQTISTIVMPDLKRPPPEFPNRRDTSAPPQSAAPAMQSSPVTPAVSEPDAENDLDIAPVVLPEPPFNVAPEDANSAAPPLGDEPVDEAEVQIIRIERRQPTPSPVVGAQSGASKMPAAADDSIHDGWSPFDLARRLDRYAPEDETDLEAALRFSTEVEEASVQIIRSEKDQTAADVVPDSADRQSPRPNAHKPEPKATPRKRPERRFLSALTGKPSER